MSPLFAQSGYGLVHCNQSSTTVVYLSKNTIDRKWVEWEVTESIKLGKRVVAVYPGANAPSTLPGWIKEHKVKVVAWSALATELNKP